MGFGNPALILVSLLGVVYCVMCRWLGFLVINAWKNFQEC